MPDTQSGDSATIELPDPQSRDALAEQMATVYDFFVKHPVLPAPSTVMFRALPGDATAVSVYTSSRAELDALAGYFGQSAPADSKTYVGAQFYVHTPGLQVTVGFHAEMPR